MTVSWKQWKVALPLAVAAAIALAARPAAAQDSAPPSTAARTISLEQALETAERESENVAIARAELQRAGGERRRARSAYFPQLTGSATYTRTLQSQFSRFQSDSGAGSPGTATCAAFTPRPGLPVEQRLDSLEAAVECAGSSNPFAAFADLPFGRVNQYALGLSLSQTLFSGGRVSGQAQAAQAGVRGAEIGLTAARAQLLLDVTESYYDAALGDRLVSIAEATLVQADTTLSQTRLAQEVGNQSEFDLLRAQVTRDNQRPIVIQRRADRDIAYDRLKQLLNLPLEQRIGLSTGLGDTALVAPPQLAALVPSPGDTSAASRATVRQAEQTVAAQRGLLRVARAQRVPQLALSSQFNELGYPGDISPFGTDFISDWTVSVGLRLPLFTGGRIGGDVDVAIAGVVQANQRLRQTRELAQLDARRTATQLAAAVAAWQASAGTVEQATRAYQIAEIRYREGISTQTELNDSRLQLQQAEASRARAARDLQVAKVRLALLPALPLAGAAGSGAAAVMQSIPTAAVQPPQVVPAASQGTAGTAFTGGSQTVTDGQ